MSAARRVLALSGALGATFFVSALLVGSASSGAAKPTVTVRVEARDFSFKLSRSSVPAGSSIRFVVRNRGRTVHDFVVKGRRTRLLKPGQSQTLTVSFPRKGIYGFLCSVPGHARLGMKGTLGVAVRPTPPPKPPPPVDTSDAAVLTRIGKFEQPVLATAPPGDSRRLFVVEQTGAVRIVRGGQVLPDPYLDLRSQVTARGESGLLAIAFSPDYELSGRVYVLFNARRGPYGDLELVEFRRSAFDPDAVDPSTARTLLTIPKPFENHNGGMLQFGPDGLLYASIGDGDPGVLHPPGFFAQRRDVLLGSIVRIDPRGGDPYAVPQDNPFVAVPGARPEIWAYGLRNPWRFWIDHESGAMFIGDVGSTSREEIDLVPRGEAGLNFGWPCFEGTLVFDEAKVCERAVPPLLDVPRTGDVCAIIGGVVVRDTRIPALAGRYLYGDLCAGTVTAVAIEDGPVAATSDELGLTVPGLSSFGVDALARVYLMSVRGDLFRLDPDPST